MNSRVNIGMGITHTAHTDRYGFFRKIMVGMGFWSVWVEKIRNMSMGFRYMGMGFKWWVWGSRKSVWVQKISLWVVKNF